MTFRNSYGIEVLQFEADQNYDNSIYIFAALDDTKTVLMFSRDADRVPRYPEFTCSVRAFRRVVNHMQEGVSLRVKDAMFSTMSPGKIRFTAACGDRFFVTSGTMRAILEFAVHAEDLVVIV